MTETKQLTITTETGRIDKALTQLLPDYSRSQIQQWLKKDLVQVNDQPCKSNRKVVTGDVVTVNIPDPVTLDLTPEDIPLDIVYEDDQVLVVNKPQGMVVHQLATRMGHWSTLYWRTPHCLKSTASSGRGLSIELIKIPLVF